MIIEKFNYSLDKINIISTKILEKIEKNAIIIVTGNPGIGKSTLIGAIIKQLESSENLFSSPTFSKVHEYNNIIHMDLYQCNNLDHYYHYFNGDKLILIEWGDLWPIEWDYKINLKYINDETRELSLIKNIK